MLQKMFFIFFSLNVSKITKNEGDYKVVWNFLWLPKKNQVGTMVTN